MNNQKFFMILLTLGTVMLAACGDSSAESSTNVNNQSVQSSTTQDADDTSSEIASTNEVESTTENAPEDTNHMDSNEEEETSNDTATPSNNEETSTTNDSEKVEADSKKDTYLKKLNQAKKATEELEATDSSTFALKKVENDRWEIWDGLLNEMYGVLEEQLEPAEMDQLRQEQRNWIAHRDESALTASHKYKGGTQEHLEYVAVLANLTEERCYELVENYMK